MGRLSAAIPEWRNGPSFICRVEWSISIQNDHKSSNPVRFVQFQSNSRLIEHKQHHGLTVLHQRAPRDGDVLTFAGGGGGLGPGGDGAQSRGAQREGDGEGRERLHGLHGA